MYDIIKEQDMELYVFQESLKIRFFGKTFDLKNLGWNLVYKNIIIAWWKKTFIGLLV